MVTRRGDNGPDAINFRALGNSNDGGYGLGGNDRLYGGSGSDRLYGQNDDDALYGDAGNDFLYGGAGTDRLYGGVGNDQLYGGAGNDRLDGGAGNDRLYGDAGYDTLLGGTGNDYLKSGGGTEGGYFDGGAGRDILDGSGDQFVFEDLYPIDTYRIAFGQSAANDIGCDIIVDWFFSLDETFSHFDRIDSNIAGSQSNYTEITLNGITSMNQAKTFADNFASDAFTHALIYNENTDTGYLVSDLNNDEIYETGVIIRGLGSMNEIGYFAII